MITVTLNLGFEWREVSLSRSELYINGRGLPVANVAHDRGVWYWCVDFYDETDAIDGELTEETKEDAQRAAENSILGLFASFGADITKSNGSNAVTGVTK